MTTDTQAPDADIICPMCHGANPHDAIFCGNPKCGKALGDFRYVIEEFLAASTWLQRLADRVSAFVGQPHFITLHVVWFTLWILLNSGLIAYFSVFDAYPYGLLGIVLAVEATLITSCLLISNVRQSSYADKRAELDYEVNVRTFRKIGELHAHFGRIVQRLEEIERRVGVASNGERS